MHNISNVFAVCVVRSEQVLYTYQYINTLNKHFLQPTNGHGCANTGIYLRIQCHYGDHQRFHIIFSNINRRSMRAKEEKYAQVLEIFRFLSISKMLPTRGCQLHTFFVLSLSKTMQIAASICVFNSYTVKNNHIQIHLHT